MVRRGFLFSGSGDDFIALPENLFPIPTSGSASTPFSFDAWFQTTAAGVILGQQDQPPFDAALAGNVAAQPMKKLRKVWSLLLVIAITAIIFALVTKGFMLAFYRLKK